MISSQSSSCFNPGIWFCHFVVFNVQFYWVYLLANRGILHTNTRSLTSSLAIQAAWTCGWTSWTMYGDPLPETYTKPNLLWHFSSTKLNKMWWLIDTFHGAHTFLPCPPSVLYCFGGPRQQAGDCVTVSWDLSKVFLSCVLCLNSWLAVAWPWLRWQLRRIC